MTFKQLEASLQNYHQYDMRGQLERHIHRRSVEAFRRGDAARDAIIDKPGLKQRQRAVREGFSRCLGGLPDSSSPLKARTTQTLAGKGYSVECVIFESRPNVFVTSNLYIPDGLKRPAGAVILLSGHDAAAKHSRACQSACAMFVKAGLVVLAMDPIGQGERFSYYDAQTQTTTIRPGTQEHDYAGVQCQLVGDSIARYFVHDTMRAIDYLCERPEVDGKRIGATGASGGGLQTCMLALADPRLAAAAPGAFFMSRESYMFGGGAQDAEQIWPGFTAAGFDHEDILIAMCPRPVLILANTMDFFPIEGARRSTERCRRFYEMCGAPGNLDIVERVAGHSYDGEHLAAAVEFFVRHLGGNAQWPEVRNEADSFKPSRVFCTRSGQVRGEIKNARFVFEENKLRYKETKAASTKKKQEEKLAWLRERVFFERAPAELNPRRYFQEKIGSLMVEAGYWWSQPDLFNHALMFRDVRYESNQLPVTVAVWDGGCQSIFEHHQWIQAQCGAGRAIMVLEPSGCGSITPRSVNAAPPQANYGTIHKFVDDLAWLDDNLAALRTYDVLRSLDMLEHWPGIDATNIRGYSSGKHGLYVRLAALLDKRLRSVEVFGDCASFRDTATSRHYEAHDVKSIVLRGVLRYFDM